MRYPNPTSTTNWFRKRAWLPLAAFCLLVAASAALSSARAAPLQCTEQWAGRLECQAGVRCACRYFPASAGTGLPTGWRWDCGVLRSRCVENVPATAPGYYGDLPYVVEFDSTVVNQGQSQTQTGN